MLNDIHKSLTEHHWAVCYKLNDVDVFTLKNYFTLLKLEEYCNATK